jgi:hypothetical protein
MEESQMNMPLLCRSSLRIAADASALKVAGK